MKNGKGFTPIAILIIVVAILFIGGGIYLYKNNTNNDGRTSLPDGYITLKNNDIIQQLYSQVFNGWNWLEKTIPFQPTYHNQEENAAGVWRIPDAVQFISDDNFLARFGDDNNTHIAVVKVSRHGATHSVGEKELIEIIENKGVFTAEEYRNILTKYGDPEFLIDTYTTDLVRNDKIVTYEKLTEVSENVFMENYWEISE